MAAFKQCRPAQAAQRQENGGDYRLAPEREERSLPQIPHPVKQAFPLLGTGFRVRRVFRLLRTGFRVLADREL